MSMIGEGRGVRWVSAGCCFSFNWRSGFIIRFICIVKFMVAAKAAFDKGYVKIYSATNI